MTVISSLSSSSTLKSEPTCDPACTSCEETELEWNDCDIPIHLEYGSRGQEVSPGSPSPSPSSISPSIDLRRNPFIYCGSVHDGGKPKNIILFGETGVGKSSVINLMAGAEVAPTSPNLNGCTLHATEYSFLLGNGVSFRIHDTVGLNEPEMGINSFFAAVEQAHKLVTALHAAGGIDLLVFCIRGGRITGTMQRNYRLFFEIMGARKIPMAFVVMHLENEERMESWWERNERTFYDDYGFRSIAHACITAAPARVTMYTRKREKSCDALQRMFYDAFRNADDPPYVKDVGSWVASLIEFLRSILMKSSWFKKKDLSRRLENRCAFSRDEAQKLANILARP